MRLLVVGGAGYVGSILRPILEGNHSCRYFDLKPVPGAGERCIVGDVNDDVVVAQAMREPVDALVWLAMGTRHGFQDGSEHELDHAFQVNVRGLYRVLSAAAAAGVRRYVHAGSMSVHARLCDPACFPITEASPDDAWEPYGMSKRIGEFIGRALVERHPDATFLSLRLMWPRNDEDWPGHEFRPGKSFYALGPNDLRRLFVAALAFERPGFHAVQASGDLGGDAFPNARVADLLGWQPEGR